MSLLNLIQEPNVATASGTTTAAQAISVTSTTLRSTIIILTQGRTATSSPTFTVTDNLSSTYAAIAGVYSVFGSTASATDAFILTTAPAGITTVTVTPSISAWVAIQAFEIAGLSSSPVIQVKQATGNSSSAASGASGLASINETLVGWVATEVNNTIGNAANWTMETTLQSSSAPIGTFRAAKRTLANQNAIQLNSTLGASGLWCATEIRLSVLEPFSNNYQSFKAGNGMSVTEKVR